MNINYKLWINIHTDPIKPPAHEEIHFSNKCQHFLMSPNTKVKLYTHLTEIQGAERLLGTTLVIKINSISVCSSRSTEKVKT